MAERTTSIETERLHLRLAGERDVPAIVRYYRDNASHLAPSHPAWPEDFFTDAFWLERVLHDSHDFAAGLSARFVLFERARPAEIIGSIHFSDVRKNPMYACFLGYHLAADKQGRGLMTEALRAAVRWAFEALGLHRIMANYMPSNERSANVLRRLGFTVEGYARDYLLLDGAWRDHILTSLINPGQPS